MTPSREKTSTQSRQPKTLSLKMIPSDIRKMQISKRSSGWKDLIEEVGCEGDFEEWVEWEERECWVSRKDAGNGRKVKMSKGITFQVKYYVESLDRYRHYKISWRGCRENFDYLAWQLPRCPPSTEFDQHWFSHLNFLCPAKQISSDHLFRMMALSMSLFYMECHRTSVIPFL